MGSGFAYGVGGGDNRGLVDTTGMLTVTTAPKADIMGNNYTAIIHNKLSLPSGMVFGDILGAFARVKAEYATDTYNSNTIYCMKWDKSANRFVVYTQQGVSYSGTLTWSGPAINFNGTSINPSANYVEDLGFELNAGSTISNLFLAEIMELTLVYQ